MGDCTVTLEQFRSFHGIDRALFVILVRDLCRIPDECLYIMGLWLWLERGGCSNFITKVLHLPPFLINELAEEAMAILGCMNSKLFPNPPESTEIPMTHSLGYRDISLQFFQQNCLIAFQEIQCLVSKVCVPSMSDIVQNGPPPGFAYSSNQALIMGPGHIANQAHSPMQRKFTSWENGEASSSRGRQPRRNELSWEEMERNERTMFVTFSKGYPVSEEEVRLFFTDGPADCIEELHMQEVRRNEQALYARIVFTSPSFIHKILNGFSKAKFTINGKHVWMRKFVAKENNRRPCGCLRDVNCNCQY